jgi:uncharacterized membrane protein YebE (DUF533 family)
MLKNIIWMVSGLALGLLIWAAYAQYKKAKDKKAAEAAAETQGAPTPIPTPTTPTTLTGPGITPSTVSPRVAPLTNNLVSDY